MKFNRGAAIEAMLHIGNGVIQYDENQKLRESLQTGKLSNAYFYEQVLRSIFRFVILFRLDEQGKIIQHHQKINELKELQHKENHKNIAK